ncbi:MAG: SPFH domain-containing protein, partial [Phycisphaerae bacterium]
SVVERPARRPSTIRLIRSVFQELPHEIHDVGVVIHHEEAVVLRFGSLAGGARNPGLSLAWPFPIDETLRVRTTAVTLRADKAHWFKVSPEEVGTPLSNLSRARKLRPGIDGVLVTGDRGLAHVKWSIVYRIDDLARFVNHVSDYSDEKTEQLIHTLLETAAVDVASRFTASEITQARTDDVAREVKRLMNLDLEQLETGIRVTSVEIPTATVPLQTLFSFARVTQAESIKETKIQEAKQKAADLLNEAAGAAHTAIIETLDALDVAKRSGDDDAVARLGQALDELLEIRATGKAGAAIRHAKASYTQMVQGIAGDVEEFDALLSEYQRNPEALIDRLWRATERRILASTGVTKFYLPPSEKEIRIKIGPDPRDKRAAEKREYEKKEEIGGLPNAPELDLGSQEKEPDRLFPILD